MLKAIITGGTAGLGLETVRALLAAGYRVGFTYRNQAKGAMILERLGSEYSSELVEALPLDLSKSASIKSFAQRVSNQFGNWDVLVNNAGAKVLRQYCETDFGCEYHFGANALGHFALTKSLLASANNSARIVSVSSIVAHIAPAGVGPVGSAKSYSPGASYAASKLANLMFSMELNRRVPQGKVRSLAAHPGFARAQPYGSATTKFFESLLAQSASKGALPIISAAIDPAPTDYLGPKYLELWGRPTDARIPRTITRDRLNQNWEILERMSQQLLGI